MIQQDHLCYFRNNQFICLLLISSSMPFTFAHPFIVLPFNKLERGWVSLTGLVMGSIIPDFEYFFRMRPETKYSHEWLGILWFDFPLALLFTFIFHNNIRNTLIDHMPPALQKKTKRYKRLHWNSYFTRNWNLVVVSIFIGILSHFFLDAFTNEHGFFVESLPVLKTFIPYQERFITIHNILHAVLSVGGLLAVVYSIWQLPVEKRIRVNENYISFWLLLLGMSIFIFGLGYYFLTTEYIKKYYYLYTANFVIIAISSLLISLLVTALFFKNRR